MTRREELKENYEDALLRLMMDETAENEGRGLLEESEHLKNDPDSAVPEGLNERCLRAIQVELNKKRKPRKLPGIRKVVNIAACFVCAVMLLFTSAYAAIPELRVATLNMMIESSNVSTELTLAQDNAATPISGTILGYTIPTMPKGFVCTMENVFDDMAVITFENADGKGITYTVIHGYSTKLAVDTEEADFVEDVDFGSLTGIVVVKEDWVHIAVGDTEKDIFIYLDCTGIEKESALEILYSIEWQG